MKAWEISQSFVFFKSLQEGGDSRVATWDIKRTTPMNLPRRLGRAQSTLGPVPRIPSPHLLGLPLSPSIWRQAVFSAQATRGSSKSDCELWVTPMLLLDHGLVCYFAGATSGVTLIYAVYSALALSSPHSQWPLPSRGPIFGTLDLGNSLTPVHHHKTTVWPKSVSYMS